MKKEKRIKGLAKDFRQFAKKNDPTHVHLDTVFHRWVYKKLAEIQEEVSLKADNQRYVDN